MFRGARALTGAAALAVALAAAPATAQAEVRQVYDAWFSAQLLYDTTEASENGRVTRSTESRIGVTGWLYDLTFIDGRLITQRSAKTLKILYSEADSHYVNGDVEPPSVNDCDDHNVTIGLAGFANPLSAFDPKAGPTTIGFTPVPAADFGQNCSYGAGRFSLGVQPHSPGALGPDHLRAEIVVPRDKLGDETIDLEYGRVRSTLRRCPGTFVESDLRTCKTVLTGRMRLYRTFDDTPEPEDELLAPPPIRRPQLDRGASRARATVRCPSGCRTRIRIFLPPRGGRGRLGEGSAAAAGPRARAAAGAGAAIASASGRLPAGRAARTLSVAIPASQRAAVLEGGGALVEVTLDPPAGQTVRSTSFARVSG
ncbi:MAG TPA: hypothetical protein VLK58_05900 [Conexibacter sp.]|nr:hypothetical protein [Conexibacter sp.]